MRTASVMGRRTTGMGNSRWHSDRTDPLHSLSRAAPRGSLQVLQQAMRFVAQPATSNPQSGARRSGSEACDLDLTHRCEHCGAALPDGSRADRKYCSTKCSSASEHLLDKMARQEARAGRHCAACGKVIPSNRRISTLYCGDHCQRQINRERERRKARHMKICPYCGKVYRTHDKRRVYCSQKCQWDAKRKPIPICRCEYCRKEFKPKIHKGIRGTTFCSLSCSSKYFWAVGAHEQPQGRPYLTAARLDRLLGSP